MAIALSLRSSGKEERRVEFPDSKVTIGSDPLCDVNLSDDGVAGEQAVLVQRGSGVELFDIGDRGDVLVNGHPTRQAALRPGDEVTIGKTTLKLLSGELGVSFTDAASTIRASLPGKPLPESASRLEAVARPRLPESERPYALLGEVGRLIRSIGSTENVFESILDTVFASIPVRRAFLAQVDEKGELRVKAQRDRERGAGGRPIEVSRTLVGKVLDHGQSVLTSDAEADPNFSAAQSIHRLRIKAAICVPLLVGNKVTGLLYGDNREEPGALTKEDLVVLNALAGVAGTAIEKFRLLEEYEAKRKIDQALAIARTIHRNFLPDHPPEVAGLEIWGRSESCDETGGDYYDYFPSREGSLGVVVGDVTGHGIGPALLMATVRAALRALLEGKAPLEELFPRLNSLLRGDIRDGRFVTLFYAEVDRDGRMRHVGAGHTPPLLFRDGSGEVLPIKSGGPPLGIFEDIAFPLGEEIKLQAGDVVLFPTDGLLEAASISGECFGVERLCEVLAGHAREGVQPLVEAVYKAVDRFVGYRPLRDDATLVALRYGS